MANEATDLFMSVIKFSKSLWHIATRLGCLPAILLMTLKAAYLLTGLDALPAN